MPFLQEFMPEGEAERLENEVIDAALEWTALTRHDGEPDARIKAAAAVYTACRKLHTAREHAFARKLRGGS